MLRHTFWLSCRKPLFPVTAATKKPAFLTKLEAQRNTRNVAFKLPSLLTVEEFCDEVGKFCRRVEDDKNNHSGNKQPNKQKQNDLFDYPSIARSLSATIRPHFIRQYLLDAKVFDPQQERDPLIPFQSAREMILHCLPRGGDGDSVKKRFAETEIQYVEYDKYAQPHLFSGITCTSTPHIVPCVCIMGHIDHGKTTLLDTLQSSNITATEPGLITQTIRAFTIKLPKKQVAAATAVPSAASSDVVVSSETLPTQMTFIDTPGHRIFAEIRLIGSSFAHVVLLLVSLEEGVKGQTEEIVKTALQLGTPMVVCLTKVDMYTDPGTLTQRIALIRRQLSTLGVHVSFVDGDVSAVDRAVATLRDKWYLLDKKKRSKGSNVDDEGEDDKFVDRLKVELDPTGQQRLPVRSAEPRRVCIGICISAKFGINIDLLIHLLQRITAHESLPRASIASSPVQACVLESFRDFSSTAGGANVTGEARSSRAAMKQAASGGTAMLSSAASSKQGPVTVVAILRNGTLRLGTPFIADMGWGVIERVTNTWGDTLVSRATAAGMETTIQPGTAVVILGSRGTACPAPSTHLVAVRSAEEAEFVSRFRNRLRFFIERHTGLVSLLRPEDKQSAFLHVGNYGQADLETNYAYRLLYKDPAPPEVKESPTELQWRANQLPPEERPQTMDEYTKYSKDSCVLHVMCKVDNWSSARVALRELPRLATKNVLINIMGIGFGPITQEDIQMFGRASMIVSFRAPRLRNSHIEFAMRSRGILYGEFDVYTDMIEWIKKHVLAKQTEESAKRSAEKTADSGAQVEVFRAAGFESEKMTTERRRTSQQLTPVKRN